MGSTIRQFLPTLCGDFDLSLAFERGSALHQVYMLSVPVAFVCRIKALYIFIPFPLELSEVKFNVLGDIIAVVYAVFQELGN